MREIKFRAWDTKKNRMLKNVAPGTVTYFDDGGNAEAEDCELMQFTGLKDKNGKEIYEGDITSNGWAICFDGGMFAPFYDFGRQERFEDVGTDWWSTCEVIGNIYENPELIKN